MKTWWSGLTHEEREAVGGSVVLLLVLAVFVWAASNDTPLRQQEVILGDGTKATCVVVQGYRSAGVTCIPHVVLGPDAEEDKP